MAGGARDNSNYSDVGWSLPSESRRSRHKVERGTVQGDWRKQKIVSVGPATDTLSQCNYKRTSHRQEMDLKVQKMSFQEVQRIASILNINVSRFLEEDTVIDGQPVAAGAVYTVNLSQIHTDEDLFKNHKQFRPERFLEDINLEKKLIPFGIGKRSCPGESLARAELYLVCGNKKHDCIRGEVSDSRKHLSQLQPRSRRRDPSD